MGKSRMQRIDKDLDQILRELAKSNNMTIREASKNLASAYKNKIKGSKLNYEIKF